jgi:hypothetical protein
MSFETLDGGTLLTDEAVNKIVADAYAALEKGAYKVIPNPHKRQERGKLSTRRRAELVKAVIKRGIFPGP